MIKFKQKEYIAPALAAIGARALPMLNTAGNIAMVGGVFQGAKQMKQANEQAKQAEEQNQQITKALNKIAENAKNNPQVSQQVTEAMSQRQFAKINFTKLLNSSKSKVKDLGKFGKDVGGIAWEKRNHLIGGTLMGASMGLANYATDKAIQADMKKSGIPLQKNYAISGKSIMSGLKKAGKVLGEAAKDNKKSIATMAILGSAPTALGYIAEKQQYKDQIKNTSLKEKSYSFKIPKFISNRYNKFINSSFYKKPGETILGGMSSFLGGGGKKGVHDFGKNLYNRGVKSGSKTSQKVGKFIMNNPKTALTGSIPVGLGIMSATWDQGEKLVKKGAKAIDNNAYAYQESKEQEIQ